MNKKIKILVFIVVLFTFIFSTGYTNLNPKPQTVYRVYLSGKSLGLIKSKKSFENYVNEQQKSIKEKYKVDKVYAPAELDIVKEITFESDLKTNKEIYEEIKDISSFTIDGYSIKIKGLESKDSNGKKVIGKSQTIYVLDKKIFTDSVEKTAKSFIKPEDYENYANDTQPEIKETGTIIDNIYIKNKITIKKDKIPVNKTIYQKEEDLSKYLLFGTTKPQAKYTIKDGDTISDVAFDNKISIEEFLIANPDLQDENSLLSPGQEVTLGILKPQISIVEEDHVVKDEEQNFNTKTEEDPNQYTDYSQVKQTGIKGLNRVTQKVQKVNGETVSLVGISTEVLKEPVEEVVVKGTKQRSYGGGSWSGGYGDLIVTKGMFGWPATCSTVSSPFGWRWGVLHDGMDIAGCGYGSNIFAAESGTVYTVSYKYDNGQYITIQHDNGYFTMYAHLCSGCTYVKQGDRVQRGQPIGGMGQTGFATGVHLHYAIWTGPPYYGGTALNPMAFY